MLGQAPVDQCSVEWRHLFHLPEAEGGKHVFFDVSQMQEARPDFSSLPLAKRAEAIAERDD